MKRTGAAAAVATDRLAVPDATSLGIIGAGVQSYTQLEAIAAVRDIEAVVVSDLDEERVADFIDTFDDRFDVRAGSPAEAAGCDVLSTVTPVEDPIVGHDDIGDHTHVNAMGADAAGKHELADELLADATIVIDDHEQCTHSGEINVPYAAGTLTDDDIYGELGEIVVGRLAGRAGTAALTLSRPGRASPASRSSTQPASRFRTLRPRASSTSAPPRRATATRSISSGSTGSDESSAATGVRSAREFGRDGSSTAAERTYRFFTFPGVGPA